MNTLYKLALQITRKEAVKMQSIKQFMRGKPSISAILMMMSGLGLSTAASAFDVASLKVSEAGVYEVGIDSLPAADALFGGGSVNFSRLGLRSQGRAVPIEIVDDGNGVMDAGDAVRFVGQGVDTLYTDQRVYTLSLDSGAARMSSHDAAIPSGPSAPSYIAKREYAPQSVYSLTSPTDDPWYANRLLSFNKVAETSISLAMDNYVSSAGAPQLSVKIWGDSDLDGTGDDHHVEVYVNNAKVGDASFDGVIAHEISQSLSTGTPSGTADIKIKLPGDSGFLFDIVNIDEVSLSYPRRFVADGKALNFSSHWPKYRMGGFASADILVYAEQSDGSVSRINNVLAGGNCSASAPNCQAMFGGLSGAADYYAVASNGVLSPEVAVPLEAETIDVTAEVVVIAHPDFIGLPNNPLEGYVAQLSSENPGGAALIDVEQIYAQYSDGEFGAGAIVDYIQAAAGRGATTVVLVGGDVFDYRDYKQTNAKSFIPSLYVSTNHIVHFTPSDPKYADVDGDNVPDLVIARLPVRSEAELNVMLNKRAAYMNNAYNGKALFAADKTSEIDQYDFGADSDEMITKHFGDWNISRAYLDDMAPEAANALVSAKINEGSALTVYSGHSSTNQLSFYGLFDGADAAGLNNIGSPTVITQWGCWNTYNVNPEAESMSHQFLLAGEQGAAAVLGSSVVAKAGAEKQLANLFYAELTQGKTLGAALLAAKQTYAQNNGRDLDVLLGTTEMGFPQLMVQ